MQSILKKLIEGKSLVQEEVDHALNLALSGNHDVQVGALLSLLEAKGVEAKELYWVLEFIEGKCPILKTSTPVLDIVGTGGDHAGTFNVSTGSAILASACGVKVAKHGNRSISSKSGSIDVLEALGVVIELKREDYLTCLDEVGIAFMPATVFHSTWRALREIRSKLKIRTLLNLVGPLLNPARARYQLVGVYKEELLDLVADALFKQKKIAMVVSSHHIDELTPLGPAHVRVVSEKGVKTKKIDPEEFGIKKCTLEGIKGQDAKYNAEHLIETFKGREGPWAETLILNTGCALYVRGAVDTIREGIDLARSQLKAGAAYQKLKEIRELTQKLKG